MLLLLYLLSFGWTLKIRPPTSPHQLYNYTWKVINKVGDTAFSISQVANSPPWPKLTPDLCKLALGTSPDWGVPHLFTVSQTSAPREETLFMTPRCANNLQRASLASNTGKNGGLGLLGLYVCPGGHKDRSLNYRCRYQANYYCASWSCETTGDAYWHPSSSWDYITVKTAYSSAGNKNDCNGWCIPLAITFTNHAKSTNVQWTGRGHEWGLRLYIPYVGAHDPGLLFKIKLSKNHPFPPDGSIM